VAAKRASNKDLKTYVEQLYKKGLSVAEGWRALARVNDAFVKGDQWDFVDYAGGKPKVKKDAWFDDEGVPRFAVNETAPILMTWSSLMTKDRPTVSPVPASEEPLDTYKAEIGAKIIEFLEQELDTANVTYKAVNSAGKHGTGGIKICFSKAHDKLTWSRLTIFDYVIDPTHADYKKANWVIFEDHISEDDAWDLFEKANVQNKKPSVVKYKNAAGDEVEGVSTRELWQRPCRAYPQGLYVYLVDGEVVERFEEYPYIFTDDSGEQQYPLPLVLMRVRDVESIYGATNLTDVVVLQRGYNEMVSRITKQLRDGTTRHLKVPDTIDDDFDIATSSVIKFKTKSRNDVAAAGAIGWTEPGEPARALVEQRDFFRQSMQVVMGLNEVTTGNSARSLSGRAIENLVELDEQRNADATREMQAMVRDGWQLSWQLVGMFYTDVRKAKISGGDVQDVLAFNNTDVVGMDVKLELSSELDKMSTVDKLATKERIDQGIDGPMDLDKAKNSPGFGLSKQIAEEIIGAVLEGMPFGEEMLPDDLNLDVFLEVLRKHMARALSERDQLRWTRLERLRREVSALAERANELAPLPGPAEKPKNEPLPA
jgi:hypothetical protein